MASTKKSRSKNRHGFGNHYITLGLIIILFTLIGSNYTTLLNIISPTQPVVLNKIVQSNIKPLIIELGKSQSVAIEMGQLSQNNWTLSKNKAVYLESSGQLDKTGNMVIYGHNTDNVFGKIADLKPNDLITITGSNHKKYHYKVTNIDTVQPTEVSILNQTGKDKRLTLFTCTSLFDSMRLVVIAKQV